MPAVSKHLRVLERAGLIIQRRDAQWRRCRIKAGPLALPINHACRLFCLSNRGFCPESRFDPQFINGLGCGSWRCAPPGCCRRHDILPAEAIRAVAAWRRIVGWCNLADSNSVNCSESSDIERQRSCIYYRHCITARKTPGHGTIGC
jgi:DNA-binding transcriptional ArsR family regulator